MSKRPGIKKAQPVIEARLAKYNADRAAAQVILDRWRNRFPSNAYAWPGAPEDFAIEALRAIRGEPAE